jgi:pyruvate kinase
LYQPFYNAWINLMKTKIIATIGPSSSGLDTLTQMKAAGMDVCRLNFSHGDQQAHREVMTHIQMLNSKLDNYVAVMADLQGPKIRLGDFELPFIALKTGDTITLTTEEVVGTSSRIGIRYQSFAADAKKGEAVIVDDGKILLRIIDTDGKSEVLLRAENEGILYPRKGVNLPDTDVSLPSLTEKDLTDLDFILQNEVHWIALSFVRTAQDIMELRDRIEKHPCANKPRIIAKIEKPQAVQNIEAIIDAADAIMIARGDLGVELPMQMVPMIQKRIISQCQKKGRPVIVATQMMEAMITNIRPTRAEVNDVANSILDGADALMLSGETSVGQYPVETIGIMQRIINEIEDFEDIYHKQNPPERLFNKRFISDAILFNASEMAQLTQAKAIVVVSYSGYSAMRLASHRPKANLFVFSSNLYTLCALSLVWGVKGFYDNSIDSADTLMVKINLWLVKENHFLRGALIVNVLSTPVVQKGSSNTVRLSIV